MSKTADKTSEYIRGTKPLAIILKWLRGQEDPEYEVLLTCKEGIYIAKKKERINDKFNDKSDLKDNTKTKAEKTDEELENDDKKLEDDETVIMIIICIIDITIRMTLIILTTKYYRNENQFEISNFFERNVVTYIF